MTTAIRDQQRGGRFGRDVRSGDDAGTTATTDDVGERFETAGGAIDADAVATAIIDRLLAGRAFPGPPSLR